jgi:hypothetical protein
MPFNISVTILIGYAENKNVWKTLINTKCCFGRVKSWGKCYKTFYRGNLPPFHGNIVILYYKAILP